MVKIIYNGKDIAADVEIGVLDVLDSCGDQLDAIDAVFADSGGQWSGWQPKKGDTLEIENEGYRSGTMWIDRIKQESGKLAVGAVSLPPDGRTKRSKSWEHVTLLTLAAEKAAAYGMTAQFFGVQALAYARMDQIARGDFGFLQERARLEGCTMKIDSGKIILYADSFMEGQPAVKRIGPSAFLRAPLFNNSAGQTYRSCTVSWRSFSGSYEDAACLGATLSITDIPVGSIGEAQRFAKNMLRSSNKRETAGELTIALDTTITGGNVIEVGGMGLSDGRYFVEQARHSFADQASSFRLHRCLERY